MTDRKEAEDALRRNEEHLRLALESGKMATWEWDIHTQELRWSPNLVEILGMSPGTRTSNQEIFFQCVHPDDQTLVSEALQRSITDRTPFDTEFRILWPDGSIHWMGGRGSVFYDDHGQPLRMVGIGIDITQRKRMEEDVLRQAKELLEQNRRKDQFLAMLGHELRNPLNTMQNALYLLEKAETDPARQQRFQAMLTRQVRQMTLIVDDLLDASRIAQGKIILERQRADLVLWLQSFLDDHREIVEGSDRQLILQLPSEPLWAEVDTGRMGQVLINLLQNAVKFSDAGSAVVLKIHHDIHADSVVLTVQDGGIGIQPEILPHIFETFAQAEGTRNRSLGGLGLGLSLVKGIMELHGGTVEAHSEGQGKGAVFTLRLPLSEKDTPS